MPNFSLTERQRARMAAEARRLARQNPVDISNRTQAFQRTEWGEAVARARGYEAKLAAMALEDQEEVANLIRSGFEALIVALESYVGFTWEEAVERAAQEGGMAWQQWAGPIGFAVAMLQLGARIAAYFRGGLQPFFASSVAFEGPARVRSALQRTYGLNYSGADRIVRATFPTLRILFVGPLQGCADYAQTSLERCRVGEFTPVKNIWRWATGGERCIEEATSRGWQCFDREQLADHMALSALAIAGYEGRQDAQIAPGAGPRGMTREALVATENTNIMRAVGNLVTGGRPQELREYFGYGNSAGQGWTFGPAWYPPTTSTRTYGAMIFGASVPASVMRSSISPQQVVNQVGGATRPQDAVLIGIDFVRDQARILVYRGSAAGSWRSLGTVRGGPHFDWASLVRGTRGPSQPTPTGRGFDPIGSLGPILDVPGSSTRGGGLSVTPASRGLGYALDTTGAGRRGGMVGEQWTPQGLGPRQSPAVPAVDDGGAADAWVPSYPGESPDVSGDEVYTFPEEPLHTQLGDLGLLPIIAAAVFLS